MHVISSLVPIKIAESLQFKTELSSYSQIKLFVYKLMWGTFLFTFTPKKLFRISFRVTTKKYRATGKKKRVKSNKQKVTSNEQKETRNKLKVTSNEQKITSYKQKLKSNEQRTKSFTS